MINALDGIDVIYWINLDRAKDRHHHMNNAFKDDIFKNKKIIRSKGIDYKNKNLIDMFKSSVIKQTEPEYACLLSHLETIRLFSKTNYENALILEDDISLDYKKYWTKTIKEVIDNAPKDWEILKIYISPEHKPYKKTYTLWNNPTIKYNQYNELKTMGDWGTPAYIINNKAAKKIIHKIYHNKKYILSDCIPLHVSDYFIFKLLKTYVYKHPFFTIDLEFKSHRRETLNINHKRDLNKTRKHKIYFKGKIENQEKILKIHKNKTLKNLHN